MTVASISRRPVTVGFIAWVVAVASIPAPVAARLLLGVPLVLVPRLAPSLAVAGVPRSSTGLVAPAAAWPWLAVGAGLLLAASFAMPAGSSLAGVLATPWWLLTLGGVFAWVARLRAERTWAPAVVGLARFVADVSLLTGATALVLDRLALTPMGFSPAIILLTAVHFSVAGFGLVAIAGLLAARASSASRAAVVGLTVGMPMTALGFLVDSPLAGWPGTIVVAGSGLLVALGLAPGRSESTPARAARLGASAGLAVGMLLAIGWSTALVLGVPYLDLEAMVRTHGALNLIAVLVAAWVLAGEVRPIEATVRPVLPTLGAGLALGIGAVVAVGLMTVGRGGTDGLSLALPIAALVGPTVVAWWVGRWRETPLDRPIEATLVMASGTINVAAATTAVILGVVTGGMGAAGGVAAAVGMLIFGVVLGGFVVLIATGPCAVLWVVLMRWLLPVAPVRGLVR